MASENDIINCDIASSVKFGKLTTLLNTELGEECMIGSFSKMAYYKMDLCLILEIIQ
jgi:hypothetical protein